jgi:alpha-glucoside transport system permease protein
MKQRWYVPWLYIAPALFVLGVFLVYPTVETFVVSLHHHYYRSDRAFVGLANYADALDDKPMWIALRNNFLWLVIMTSATVGIGLLLAVLLDRVRYEPLAKSVIFMPMAISFTAASIIWRFVYAYRPPSRPQIGLLNGLLTGLQGLVGHPAVHQVLSALVWVLGPLATVFWAASLTRVVWRAVRRWKEERRLDGLAQTGLIGFALLGIYFLIGGFLRPAGGTIWEFLWFLLAVLGTGALFVVGVQDQRWGPLFLAGFLLALLAQFVLDQTDFQPQAWLFLRPWTNNIALIVTGIWVWTGFCMVVLSAAYKGIPDEMLEAARIDGASEWQVFWHVTIPFMKSTIAMVTTTIVIFVLKTFDIVYVMTNGNFDTEVLANYMIRTMYSFPPKYGKASAIAMLLMLLIVPFIVINLRRFRAQEAVR